MRGKVSIIKKVFILQLFTVFMLTLSAEPYKPYPILFIHGVGAASEGCWGAGVDTLGDGDEQQLSDWVTSWESTYSQFLDYVHPYVYAWWDYENDLGLEPTYTRPEDIVRYPNKTFLEVVNMDAPWGSIDDDYIIGGGYDSPDYTSWQDELWHSLSGKLSV